MHHSLCLSVNLLHRIKPPWLNIMFIALMLLGCNLAKREYSVEEQYDLARSRVDSMKEQLSFRFALEKEKIHVGEAIFFTAYFTNKTGTPLTLRIPQQSGVSDIELPNTMLKYFITPLDKTISLGMAFSFSGTPYILLDAIQSNEFVSLDPYSTKGVRLELPNAVYLQQGESWVESVLPPGEFLIEITYENLDIGYEIEKEDEIRVVDLAAWVGEIKGDPVILTILP